jgi:outer membrane usher protein
LQFSVDHNNSSLNIAVAPSWFEPQVIELEKPQSVRAPHDVLSPQPFSGFINYQLGSSFSEQAGFDTLNIPWELGINKERWFAFSTFNSKYTDAGETSITRLQSQLIWDDPKRMNRFIIGDFTAPNSGLSSGGLFAGISIQRDFGLNRAFKYTPDFDFQTIIEKPSHAELYVNKLLVEEWELLPGEVMFPKLSNYVGMGEIELVLTDAFGQERRIQQTFHTNQQLLKPKLHEYSYNIGFNRENMGSKSNEYGSPAFLSFHRYGFSDNLTAGINFEVNKQVIHLVPTLDVNLGRSLLNTALAFSQKDGGTGYKFLSNFSYPLKQFNSNLSLGTTSREYTNVQIGNTDKIRNSHYRGNLTLSYNTPTIGGLSLGYSENSFWDDETDKVQLLSLSYRKQFGSGLMFSLGARHSLTNSSEDEIFLTFMYVPRQKSTNQPLYDNLNYHLKYPKEQEIEQELGLQKSSPRAKGYGYNAKLIRKENAVNLSGRLNYKNETGIYTANYTYMPDGMDKGRLSYASSLSLINGSLHVGRPIHDSFALVQATGLNGVTVRNNGNLVGITNANGELVVSELTSYGENRLSIDTGNLPLDYNLDKREKYVKVGQRSGSVVTFKIVKFTAVEGNLYLQKDGERKALELLPLEITINGEKQDNFTARDGYFYLENIPIGEHDLRVRRAEGDCIVKLSVPETDQIVASLGELMCIR